MAVAASEAGRRAGVSSALAGLLDWPRELGRSAATRARWASWLLLRASGPSRPSQLRAFFSSSFSIFHFFFHLFEFKFGLEFEFKTEVTYLLEF